MRSRENEAQEDKPFQGCIPKDADADSRDVTQLGPQELWSTEGHKAEAFI